MPHQYLPVEYFSIFEVKINHMLLHSAFRIDERSSLPKYRQIIDQVITAIENGTLKRGDKIPSLTQICRLNHLSRDTVMMAFNELKSRGVIFSRPGKGYFVQNTQIDIVQRIFVLFDELNAFKEDMYNSFLGHLSPNTDVDIYFHHFNFQLFNELIENAAGNYTAYVIMPATFDQCKTVISQLPKDKVYLLDRLKPGLTDYPAIYQDFEKDIYEALLSRQDLIKKYHELIMVHPGGKEPEERIKGLELYARQTQSSFTLVKKSDQLPLKKNSCYLVTSDRELVQLIKMAEKNHFQLGTDVGIISFNDTMLKEVVAGGISTISTDFIKMGESLAQMIGQRQKEIIRNPWMFVVRASV